MEVWDGLENRLLVIPARPSFRNPIAVMADEQSIFLACGDHIEEWCLTTGAHLRNIRASLPRPLRIPSGPLRSEIVARAGARIWAHAGNHFIHLGDGPRGWVTPLSLSRDGQLLAIPCETGAAIVTVEEPSRLVAKVPFEGALRAAWATPTAAKLINADGQVFEWRSA